MVAEYLEANYDKVSKNLPALFIPLVLTRSSPSPRLVLRCLRRARQVRKLRDETTVPQVIGRNPVGSNKFQGHDSLHRKRGESQNDDELVERQEQEHPV